jgi:hypothetical protein
VFITTFICLNPILSITLIPALICAGMVSSINLPKSESYWLMHACS